MLTGMVLFLMFGLLGVFKYELVLSKVALALFLFLYPMVKG